MHSSVLLLLTSVMLGAAHPGHHEESHPALLAARHEHHGLARRGLENCVNTKAYRDLQARAMVRRAQTIDYHRAIRKAKRDVDSAGTGHNQTSLHVKGEHIRSDLRDGEPGVDVVLDGQFIDVETCEPITDLYWDLWNCNATGVYSGVQESSNGNGDDASNLNSDDHVVGDELGSNADSDPFFQYVYLGDDVAEGIFGWITIGINRTASYDTSYSFEYTSSGGVAVENSGSGGVGGDAPSGAPSGTGFPSGSGAPPAATSTSA
ncbi:hypothetical protein GQ607_000596 [Colletotrichum asianum]|uniref:Uncharacterized protein n=1 Tax=Colletotrichum asianum TaxID=702518 RepID=A0A8H3WTY7_9PEZI|nr:hypothetical protein GQ607_000596 [Colletotrichum asianum]